MEHLDSSQLSKGQQFSVEDGLDQEIQRAIAQHDLEQQKLNQQSESEPPENQSHRLDVGSQSPSIKSEENLESQLAHNSNGQALSDSPIHVASGDQINGSAAPDVNEDVQDLSQSAMDAAEEKRHLQMIADELKRATTSSYDVTTEQNHESTDNQLSEMNLKQDVSDFPAGSTAEPKDDPGKSHVHPDLSSFIPANSELLATNSALAAYNALSSQVPPVVLLSAVHLAALPLAIVCPDYLPARIQLLINTLPVLDSLASQLLRIFVVGPYQKIIDLASSPDTPAGAAFRDLSSLFEFTKRLYSEEDPFLNVENLAPGMWKEGEQTPTMFRNREQSIESTLRKVNLATFLAATLGTMEVGFFHLNESFLDVFCPSNSLDPANSMSNMSSSNMNLQSGVNTVIGDKIGKILKPLATLYLDLKTQAYISAVEAGERSNEEILEDILPSNIEQILLERRGIQILSPTETDFVNRCKSRKERLLNYPPENNLSEEFEWFAFLKDVFDFVSKNMSFLIWGKKSKPPARRERPPQTEPLNPHSEEILQTLSTPAAPTESANKSVVRDGATAREMSHYASDLLPIEIQEQQIHLRLNTATHGKVYSRRPWTREEEKALRHALELKGPAWSTILELFGQGGRINEVLRHRNQVQLKDKARNWKMFFLKSGLPIPDYLQKVTGDLDREDKLRAKTARNRKTAAAPVPSVPKKNEPNETEPVSKRRKT